MRLSDAIEKGAGILCTPGPLFPCDDALVAAQAGELGRAPTIAEQCAYYWDNPHGIKPGDDLEHWLRLTVIHGYRWSDVISKLRGYGR